MGGLAQSRPAFCFSAPFWFRDLATGFFRAGAVRRSHFPLLLLLHISPTDGGETLLYIASTGPALRFSPFLLMWHIARGVTLSNRDFLM
jgi:hypothetical protein